jgi:hypothetical protein
MHAFDYLSDMSYRVRNSNNSLNPLSTRSRGLRKLLP